MNPFIRGEMDKCLVAKIEQLSNTSFLVRKSMRNIPKDIEQGHLYEIEVADYIIHPYDGFTLHDDWNNGVKPTSRIMQTKVVQIIGNMIKVEALGADGLMWSGWLPKKSITIRKIIY